MDKEYHALIYTLTKHLKISVRKQEIDNQLFKYFYSPSIKDFSNILNTWNVKNMIVNIPIYKLKEAPFPILCYSRNNDYFLITKVENDQYSCFFSDSSGTQIINEQELSNIWEDVCILMETQESSGEFNFKEKKGKDYTKLVTNLSIICSFILIVILGFFIVHGNFLYIYVLGLIGISLSLYLFLRGKSYFKNQSIDICKIGSYFDCDKVMSSNYGKMLGFSLSEISTGYFLFIILGLIFSSVTNTSYSFLIPFVYLSLLSVIYSIATQIKMKTYCIICIAISLVLILIILTVFVFNGFNFIHINVPNFIFTLSLTVLILSLTKNYLFFNEEYKNQSAINSTIMNSSLIINGFRSVKIENKNFDYEILLGNDNSNFRVILFLNPDCKRCKTILKNLSRIFSEFEDQIHLRILYSGPSENNSKPKLQFAKMYNEILTLTDIEKISFFKKQNLFQINTKNDFDNKILEVLTEQYDWSNDLDLISTPAFILNNVILPNHFGIEEIAHLMRTISLED
jgi:uncharacterized membrane protein